MPFTLANSAGWASLSQASCCACDIAKRNVGSSSISATALATVRATFRIVSRTGHNQAESMWA